MRILVTGGAGYLGSVMVGRLLGEGWSVTVVDNLMYGQTSLFQYCYNPKFTFIKSDIRTLFNYTHELEDCDILIPLAAITGPACEINPESARINSFHYQLLGIPKDKIILFPMTNSGYGTTTGEVYCTEESPLNPVSSYGREKVIAENWFMENFPNAVSFRLATVFGVSPHMRFDVLVNDMVYNAVINRGIHIYEPDAWRNYVHIQDVAECFVWASYRENIKGQIYNLGNDDINMTKLSLAKKIQEYTDCEVFISEKGKDPDKRNYIVSNDKLRHAGFVAKVGLDEGIDELLTCMNMLPRRRFRNV